MSAESVSNLHTVEELAEQLSKKVRVAEREKQRNGKISAVTDQAIAALQDLFFNAELEHYGNDLDRVLEESQHGDLHAKATAVRAAPKQGNSRPFYKSKAGTQRFRENGYMLAHRK